VSIPSTREQRRQLARDNAKQPVELAEAPYDQWPPVTPPGLLQVWRSRDFLVQRYAAPAPALWRLSVNRTTLTGVRWQDGISWDDLQRIKREAGFGFTYAVEVYPNDIDVVNVGNLRHLWLLPEPPAFAWRRNG
jgi:hypothetical protein